MEEINGERRYARHVDFTGPKGEEIKARLVYDYRELRNMKITCTIISTYRQWGRSNSVHHCTTLRGCSLWTLVPLRAHPKRDCVVFSNYGYSDDAIPHVALCISALVFALSINVSSHIG
jgi:hypothetical protein